MIVFNGVGEANAGIEIFANVMSESPLPSLTSKPVAATLFIVPLLLKKIRSSELVEKSGIIRKIVYFVKDNIEGLVTGIVISEIYHKPDKTKNVIHVFYDIIPVPLKLILLVIVVGYLSPYIVKSWSKFKDAVRKGI